ncbi:hypothetical protein CR513_05059, partial [Mucuna pruriens]
MTRSSFDPLYELDPKIEITLRRLRKARDIVVSNSSDFVSSFDNSSPVTNISNSVEFSSTNNLSELEKMENNDRTLKELATPDIAYQPWCIQYPQLEPAQTYELKSGLIHLLPKFHGLARKDPHKNLKEFHVVWGTGGLHQNEGVPILPGWSCKRLVVSSISSLQHLGRYEAHVLGEILTNIQNCDHQKGNLWDKATFWKNST